MFTGIIRGMGRVRRREGLTLLVEGALPRARRGDSVAVNGVCLTIVRVAGPARRRRIGFDLSEETLRRTTLGDWSAGRPVNLEPALRAGDPLGGHIVQGHVDGVGRLASRRDRGEWRLYTFAHPAPLARYLVPKGSVAVDGISLTVLSPGGGLFSVAVIPHTEAVTTLGVLQPGDRVNLEADVLAKHVERLLGPWRRK